MAVSYCIRCFQPVNGMDICPYCGYSNASYHPKSSFLPVGARLNGRYSVGTVLGEGGFGITYAGFDAQLRRRVAIKEFFPAGCVNRAADDSMRVTCSDAGDMRQIFEIGKQKALQEAQSLAQLDDIGDIVRVLDFFPENETAYIIMEFVEGETLRDYTNARGGTLLFEDAVSLLLPVMRALRDIHARGFIHRDISPDNIMITTSRKQAKLLDFGAVKSLADNEGGYTQNVIVKRGFSPLELYSTEDKIGPWSDVYSMCATLFFIVTGEKLREPVDRLKGDNAVQVLRSRVSEQYQAILMKGLAVQAEYRYQNMDELLRALENAGNGGAPVKTKDPDGTAVGGKPNGPGGNQNHFFVPPKKQPGQPGQPGPVNGNGNGGSGPTYLPPDNGKSNLPLILGICGAVIAVALAVLLIVLLGRKNSDDKTTETEEPGTQTTEIAAEEPVTEKAEDGAPGTESVTATSVSNVPTGAAATTAPVRTTQPTYPTGGTVPTTYPQPVTGATAPITAPTAPVTTTTRPTTTTTRPTTTTTRPTTTTTRPTTTTTTTTRPTTTTTTAPVKQVPSSKSEIVSFYKDAINQISFYGNAGYTKKKWNTFGDLNLTGVGAVDNVIKGAVANRFKTEDTADELVAQKGTSTARNNIPGWPIADNSVVKTASLQVQNGNYVITLVMQDADNPMSGSALDQVGEILTWDEVTDVIDGISAVKEYSDVHVIYRNYTITATVTPEGRILSIRHHSDVDVTIGYAKISVVSLNNKSVRLTKDASFYNFNY